MARRAVAVLSLVFLAVLLAGCTGKELKSVERSGEDGEFFQFSVPAGTDQIRVVFSTKGSPSSEGTAALIIIPKGGGGMDYAYLKELRHGQSDEATVDLEKGGTYQGILDYEDGYTGPASVKIHAVGASIGPIQLGGSFWDIAGVVLALLTIGGGWFLYRRHSSRLNREMERIDETFRELRVDVAQCRHELNDMHEDLHRQLMQGRLKESHYLILEKRIERYLDDLEKVHSKLPSVALDREVPLEME